MPRIQAGSIKMNYIRQGGGEPLALVHSLGMGCACYFRLAPEQAMHFTCFSVDLSGVGESDKPEGAYFTERFAGDVAVFLQALGMQRAMSSGTAWGDDRDGLAAKYPQCVASPSPHSGRQKSDAYARSVIGSWQIMARTINEMPETMMQHIHPWCDPPEKCVQTRAFVQAVGDFTRSRLKQPVEACIRSMHPSIGRTDQR